MIQDAKNLLKNDSVMLSICQEYDLQIDDIDLIPVKFDDISVSAETNQGVVTLNYSLIKNNSIIESIHYLIHEFQHYYDQMHFPTKNADDGLYLNNKDEQKAFKNQILFINEHQGPEKAEEYTDQVLDHHDATGKDRIKKKKILLDKIDAQLDLFLHKISEI